MHFTLPGCERRVREASTSRQSFSCGISSL